MDGTVPYLLLAEDDTDIAFLFRRAFEKACSSWNLVWASNGVVAVNHIMEHGMPHVLVTDLRMPIISGFELITWIRAKNQRPRVPIFVMSSLCESEVRQRCRALGADDFIPKMQSLTTLQHRLRGLTHALEIREPDDAAEIHDGDLQQLIKDLPR